jgi:hypothetical protein
MNQEWAALGDLRQRVLDAAHAALELEVAALGLLSQRLSAQVEGAFPVLYACLGNAFEHRDSLILHSFGGGAPRRFWSPNRR